MTTPVLSELGIQIIPTKSPRLHIMIPASQYSQLTTLSTNPLRLHRHPTSATDETRHDTHQINAILSASCNRTPDAQSRGSRLGTFQTSLKK
ncbi:UNVERIFIED_CONTAM: hypothetical protein Sradi_1910600 [Sesamum radiatum]|uniref:Uncharacterized protein n=1 Tax=Sesamum radiatum TaxID=300843 RepID=A0AAW2TZP9_SESRA